MGKLLQNKETVAAGSSEKKKQRKGGKKRGGQEAIEPPKCIRVLEMRSKVLVLLARLW